VHGPSVPVAADTGHADHCARGMPAAAARQAG